MPEINQLEFIRAKLKPDDREKYSSTYYYMFGTERMVSNFELEISKIEEGEEERCEAWGCVSYTTELDFRNITTDDVLVFYLHLREDRFTRYAEMITKKALTKGIFRVGDVDGFYSEWSPSITRSKVKNSHR